MSGKTRHRQRQTRQHGRNRAVATQRCGRMPRHMFVSSPGNKMPRPLKKLRMLQQLGTGFPTRARQRGLPTQPCLLSKEGGGGKVWTVGRRCWPYQTEHGEYKLELRTPCQLLLLPKCLSRLISAGPRTPKLTLRNVSEARSSRAQDPPFGPLRETPPGPGPHGVGGQPLAWSPGRGTICPRARSWVRPCCCCCFFWPVRWFFPQRSPVSP